MDESSKKNEKIINELIDTLKLDLETILNDFKQNSIDPKILKNIAINLKELKKKKNISISIDNLITNEHYNIFRKVILEEKTISLTTLKILRLLIEISQHILQIII